MGRPTHELLVERGVVSPEAVMRAEAAAERGGTRLCSELLAAGDASEGALVAILAERHGWPGVDLSHTEILADALRLVPQRVAQADSILPPSTEGGRLHLAVADPDGANRVLAEVRFVTGMEICPYVAVAGALRKAIVDAYAGLAHEAPSWRGAEASPGCGVAYSTPVDLSLPEGDEVIVVVDESPHAGSRDVIIPDAPAELPAPAPDLSHDARRILVVDDEPEIRTLLERALTARGFTVETAPDGEEGLARIASHPPALVLLDAMLPRIHGFEVARRLRADVRTRELPVVMMTAVYRGWRFAQDARDA